MKWIKWILEIVIGVGLLVWSVRLVLTTEPTRAGTKKKDGQVVNVVVQSAKTMKIEDALVCLGTVAARESVDISAQVTEKIIAIHFDHGQHVKKGDLLVELQSAQERAALSVAELSIAEHQREEKRLAWLLKENAIPQRDLDDRQTRLAIAKAEKAKAEADCADRKIIAPFSGIVGLRLVSLGDLVSPGTKITTLEDIEQVYVDYPVPEKYTAKLKEGMSFKASNIAYPGVEFHGTIRMVDPQVQSQTRSAQIRGVIDNKEQRLRPGMLMTVKLNMSIEECQSVLEESLTSLGEKQYVFVYSPAQKKVFRKEVTIGRRVGGRVEVVSGLDTRALVVTEGVVKISDGQKVVAEERK
jgi:membrane fusion protein (multidrug efflux system)